MKQKIEAFLLSDGFLWSLAAICLLALPVGFYITAH
jgi:hypothetical protein